MKDLKDTMMESHTLAEAIEDWNLHVNYVRNQKTTWVYYQNIQKKIIDFFGNKDVLTIYPREIMEYMAHLKNGLGLSNGTVNKHRTYLYTLWEYMILNEEYYGVERNVVQRIRTLPEADRDYKIYQPEEAVMILEKLREGANQSLETAVCIALMCGCRREEVCALKWENVNLDKRYITVREVRTTAGSEVVELPYTKNKQVRMVGIPDLLYDTLKRQMKYQKKQKHKYKDAYYTDKDYVLTEKDGRPWHPNYVSRRWHDWLKKNGFRGVRYHDLRHTNLSLLMTKMSAVEVAKLGGHKKVSTTTNTYGHCFDNVVDKGRKCMNELI